MSVEGLVSTFDLNVRHLLGKKEWFKVLGEFLVALEQTRGQVVVVGLEGEIQNNSQITIWKIRIGLGLDNRVPLKL